MQERQLRDRQDVKKVINKINSVSLTRAVMSYELLKDTNLKRLVEEDENEFNILYGKFIFTYDYIKDEINIQHDYFKPEQLKEFNEKLLIVFQLERQYLLKQLSVQLRELK